MCGIAGIWDFNGRNVNEQDLKNMARVMKHRGPDDEGVFAEKHVGLAFRRLSIIDLSAAGHQPLLNADSSLAIVFNGEIYNYKDLTKTLKNKGYVFRSKTDTEAVLHAYSEYGSKCVEHFNGMFAFAIYNKKDDSLFCARDRFGIKPLYYWKSPDRFLFASEIKSLLAVKGMKAKLNLQALNEYFTFQNIFNDETLFQNVKILLPAQTLSIDRRGRVTIAQFWKPDFTKKTLMSESEAVEELRSMFERSVQRHLMSDVPVGSQLSGGLDSASLVSFATRFQPGFKTFSAGFASETPSEGNIIFDERPDAELVARTTKSQHYSLLISHTDMERIMPKIIWHTEDLRVGNSYPPYFINELASKFVKVAWSGTGGDELFAGYVWRYQGIRDANDEDQFHQLYYSYWSRLLNDADRPNFFQPGVWKEMNTHNPYNSYKQILDKTYGLHPIDRSLYFELTTFLHGLLVIEDRMSSAHGLEVRVPFLDRELVDFALQIPHHWKVNHTTGKLIFRKAIEPYVPRAILLKNKQGFSAPEVIWFRSTMVPYLQETLLGEKSVSKAYLRPEAVTRVLNEHIQGMKNHRLLIWSLVSFEWWLRVFLNDEQPVS